MMRHLFRMGLPLLCVLASLAPSASAEPIVAGTTDLQIEAIQDITLLPGTPFNPGIVADPRQRRDRVRHHHDQPRRPGRDSTINIPSLAGGLLYGSNPGLPGTLCVRQHPAADRGGFQRRHHQRGPELRPTPATRPGSRPASSPATSRSAATASGSSSSPARSRGSALFTDPSVPFSFSATFDGLPPSPGTVIANSGPDVLNVLFNGVPVAESSNRRLIILAGVPEPGSAILGGLAVIVVGVWMRSTRRRRMIGAAGSRI